MAELLEPGMIADILVLHCCMIGAFLHCSAGSSQRNTSAVVANMQAARTLLTQVIAFAMSFLASNRSATLRRVSGEVTTGFEVQMVQVHTVEVHMVEVHMVEERLQICLSKPLELLVQHQRLLPG